MVSVPTLLAASELTTPILHSEHPHQVVASSAATTTPPRILLVASEDLALTTLLHLQLVSEALLPTILAVSLVRSREASALAHQALSLEAATPLLVDSAAMPAVALAPTTMPLTTLLVLQ